MTMGLMYLVHHQAGGTNNDVLSGWDKDLSPGVAGRDLYNFIRNSVQKGVN